MTNGFPALSVMVVIAAVFFHSAALSAPIPLECSKITHKIKILERVPCEYLVRGDLVELLMDAFHECSDRRVLLDIHRLILDHEDCNMPN